MYRVYLKQAFALIRAERFFSAIYIAGTGLAIALVMVLSVVFYVRLAPVYPEVNRCRTLVVKGAVLKRGEQKGYSSSMLSERAARGCAEGAVGLEALALVMRVDGGGFVQPDGSPVQLPVVYKPVNDGFWRVFGFRFLEGKPFGEADVEAGLRVAVISRSLARRLYGDGPAVGREMSLDFRRFRVTGVVDDPSFLTEASFSHVWLPYTAALPGGREELEALSQRQEAYAPGLGEFVAYLLARSEAEIPALREEVEDRARRFDQSLGEGLEFSLLGQPDRHWESLFRYYSDTTPDVPRELGRYALIFLLLLLVPAVSLSGLADSRMERRMAELGVRRAFGAPRGAIFGQVVAENLLYTLLGGAFGLALSYGLLEAGKAWVFKIGGEFAPALAEGTEVVFEPLMFFNPVVFLIALAVSLALNLLAALIPAWRASCRPIVYSLNAD